MSAPATKQSRPSVSWKTAYADFLLACGEEEIFAEYADIGVQFSEDKTRANGCRSCFARERDDDTSPSAYVNGESRKYKDAKNDRREIDIWQLAANVGLHGGDWQAARVHYLEKYHVDYPGKKRDKGANGKSKASTARPAARPSNSPTSRKPLESWLTHVHPDRESSFVATWIGQFAINKKGFTPSSFAAAGGFFSRWPHHGKPKPDGEPTNPFAMVVGVPVYGPAVLTAEVIDDTTAAGAVIWNKTAEPFEVKAKDKDGNETIDEIKMRTVVTGDGLIGRHGLQLIIDDRRRVASGQPSTIDRIWKVEGPTDLFALYSVMPPHARLREPIISCAGGSTSVSPWTAELIRGYHVIVCHDLDIAGNDGAIKTCELWGPTAASVVHLQLPGEVAEKKGDDIRKRILTGMTYDDLAASVLWALPFDVTDEHRAASAAWLAGKGEVDSENSATANPDADSDLEPCEADDDPHRLARVFLEQNAWSIESNTTTLRFWRQEWHQWSGRSYVHIDPTDLNGMVNKSIKQEFDRLNIVAQEIYARRQPADDDSDEADEKPPMVRKVSRGLVYDVVAAIQGQCSLPSDQEAPFWISGKGPWPAHEGFATGSGIIHLASLVDGKPDNLYPATPDFFSPNAVHYGFPNNDPAQCPTPTRWHAFLESLWADDYQQIQLLQEWMGYCLLPDTAQQKLLLFIGPKRSGKGTIARTLTQLVGENNVVNPRLSQFDKEYGMWPLVGKTVAIIGDARLAGRTDTAEIVETLLSISGEDKQTVNRKHMSYVHTRLRTRFTILSNAMPDLQDTSGAFHSRCLLLETKHSFEGRENKNLEHELLAELPGILVWAIQGWARLRERGYFEQPDSSKNALKQFEYLTSPMKKFLDEFCVIGTDEWVSVDIAYNTYCDFSKSNRLIIGPRPVFARDLKSVINHMHTAQRRDKNGERFRVFTGFRMKTESEMYFDEDEE